MLLAALALLTPDGPTNHPVDFDTQIMPVLTKAGCNAGACHGAAAGRGGFYLSLYGSRPADDFAEITLSLEGRRIDHRHPDHSLVLRKPTEMVSHGGGTRLDIDERDYNLVVRWIAEGARRIRRRALVEYSFTIPPNVTPSVDNPVPLSAVAEFSDGSRQDVLPWTVVKAADPDAVTLDPAGHATAHSPGRHLLLARYLDRVVTLELIIPFGAAAPDTDTDPDGNSRMLVDRFVDARLKLLGLRKASRTDDATLIRRLSLDLTGRIPTVQAVRQFVSSPLGDKTRRLVDALLASEEFTDYQTFRLAQQLRLSAIKSDQEAGTRYYQWLRAAVARDQPLSLTARSLITAEGAVSENPAGSFYNVTMDPRKQAEFVSSAFLGVRMQCANCHDHPLDSWTQDDYHGLAAIFARIRRGPVIRMAPAGKVIHPATGEPAVARIPGEAFIEAGAHADDRTALVDWLTSSNNPFFARAAVNRIWANLMGRGLVEPVDDLRATNPATHPELLGRLADLFAESGYRSKNIIREICLSDAYARSSRPLSGQENLDGFYASAQQKRMTPAVFLDAVGDVTEIREALDTETTRAVSLAGLTQPSSTLDLLGRCTEEEGCVVESVAGDDLAVQLHLLNGELLNRRLRMAAESITSAAAGTDSREFIDELYLRAFGREPREAERRYWQTQLDSPAAADDRPSVMSDFVWSILNSPEFRTIR